MKLYIRIIMLLFIVISCKENKKKETVKILNPIKILVSIPAQEFFVKQIVSNKIKVEVIGKNLTSHEHTISIKKLSQLSKSSMYIKLGTGGFPFEEKYEKQLLSISKNKIKIVEMAKGIKLINQDPHIWLSVRIMKSCSKNIYKSIVSLDPKNKLYYKSNYKKLLIKLDKIDKKIKDTLKNIEGKSFLSYHSAWRYFSKDYKINEIPISQNHHETLSIKKINKIIINAKNKNIKTIVIPHKIFKEKVKNIAKEIKAKIIVLNPLSNLWEQNIINSAKKLEESIAKQ